MSKRIFCDVCDKQREEKSKEGWMKISAELYKAWDTPDLCSFDCALKWILDYMENGDDEVERARNLLAAITSKTEIERREDGSKIGRIRGRSTVVVEDKTG